MVGKARLGGAAEPKGSERPARRPVGFELPSAICGADGGLRFIGKVKLGVVWHG